MMRTTPQSPLVLFAAARKVSDIGVEGDCACPSWSPSLEANGGPAALLPQTPIAQAAEGCLALKDGYFMLWTTQQPFGIAVLDSSAMRIWQKFAQPTTVANTLSDSKFDALSRQSISVVERLWQRGFLQDKGTYPGRWTKSNEIVAWLQITNRCNLNCSYCYVPPCPGDMPARVGYGIVDSIYRSANVNGLKQIRLKYAGGEPLLCTEIVRDIHEYARDQAVRLGLLLKGVVLTNGTQLTPEVIRTLKALQLDLAISVDGLAAKHDAQRPYKDGGGSFQRIERAIRQSRQYGLTPQISITLTRHNTGGLPSLVSWLLSEHLPFSINFFRPSPQCSHTMNLQLDPAKTIASLKSAYKEVENNLPNRSLLAGLLDRTSCVQPHARACGSDGSYLAFDQRGNVTRCHMLLHRFSASICEVDSLGSAMQHPTDVSKQLPGLHATCELCEWKTWCAGGCPLMFCQSTADPDPGPLYCEIYKALLPEVIRLEGLRLLKYAQVQLTA